MTAILIPGLLCDGFCWEPVTARMPAYVAEVSSQDRIEQMAIDCLAIAEGPLEVAGHSMGARVAMEMARIAPGRVRMQQAEYFRSTSQDRARGFPILGNGKSAKLAWQMQDYNATGAVGNAGAASADKGRAVLDAAGRALAQLLTEIDRLPPDTLSERTAYQAGTRAG